MKMKIKVDMAIAVEGRDDVAAVTRAIDALVIPTHGFGIAAETWQMLQKAYDEKGLIILTDPDHAGEQIRKRLGERFPCAIHAYIDRDEASTAGDVGIENAKPEVIKKAIELALEREGKAGDEEGKASEKSFASMEDLIALGLAGCSGATEARQRLTKELGIGYANATALIKKLKGFGIDSDELKEALKKIDKEA